MARYLVVLLIIQLVAFTLGCPQPNIESPDEQITGRSHSRSEEASAIITDSLPRSEIADETADELNTDREFSQFGPDLLAESVDAIEEDGEEEAPVKEPEEETTSTEIGEGISEEEQAEQEPEYEQVQTSVDDEAKPLQAESELEVLDASAYIDQDQDLGTASSERPTARVSQESMAFAGRWVVVVINQEGRARLFERADEWIFELAEDGIATITQRLQGENREQTGVWELLNGLLILKLGPGGIPRYRVEMSGEDTCVLMQEDRESALFCVRLAADEQAPAVAEEYRTDFGELELSPSGPNHWRGRYGEPEGKLTLTQLGPYLVGAWQQVPGSGFVCFELIDGGFDGVWWYEGSMEFDGAWRGSTTN